MGEGGGERESGGGGGGGGVGRREERWEERRRERDGRRVGIIEDNSICCNRSENSIPREFRVGETETVRKGVTLTLTLVHSIELFLLKVSLCLHWVFNSY